MTQRKKVLILSYSNLSSDPRVLRQIQWLEEKFDIYTAGLTPSGKEIQFAPVNQVDKRRFFVLRNCTYIYVYNRFAVLLLLKVLKLYRIYYWSPTRQRDLKSIPMVDFDLIIANDIHMLPIAARIKSRTGAKILFDAHEYTPLEYENNKRWLKLESPYYTFLAKYYTKFADHRITVGENIAIKYKELTGYQFDVMYNAPAYQVLDPSEVSFPIQFVHHGGAMRVRELERMIEIFKDLPKEKFQLNLILMKSDPDYYNELVKMSKDYENIVFHEPVSTAKIAEHINQFDVGFVIIPPVNFNYKNSLPNKFFESVQGRLMLACGGSDEERKLISKYRLGIHFSSLDQEVIVKEIVKLTPEIVFDFKQSVNKSAEALSASKSFSYLTNVLRGIT